MRQTVEIYTDGACSGNPGPGGWAACLMFGPHYKEISGFVKNTTNQRMELMAAIRGLEQLKRKCRVRLYSDSAYLINAFTRGWIENWQKNGWVNARRQPVANDDLWRQLVQLAEKHEIEWIKVKGHSDNEYNNRCDALARSEIERHT
ncbi:MAG: ribonuclease HI [Firmicutes bacterium]|nr:ribonuclease HI [Bacillota bacterium]NLO66718.1 ribonuclease HI [Bacillota bacterium]